MEKDRITILGLQNRAMNQTLQKCKEETKDQIQDLKLQTALYQIETLKFEVTFLKIAFSFFNFYAFEAYKTLSFFLKPNRLNPSTKPLATGMKLSW
jgi:hypothetical protein